MKCLACNAPGRMHKTLGAFEFGPACTAHAGLAWGLWFETDDKYLNAVDRWLLRRERAIADGVQFTELPPKGPGEKAVEIAIFEADLTADAEELS